MCAWARDNFRVLMVSVRCHICVGIKYPWLCPVGVSPVGVSCAVLFGVLCSELVSSAVYCAVSMVFSAVSKVSGVMCCLKGVLLL